MVQNGPNWSQLVPNGDKWCQIVRNGLNGPQWSPMVHNGLQWSQMISNGPKYSTNDLQWFQTIQCSQKGQHVSNDTQWSQ